MIDNYITGNTIRRLREQKNMTQAELADKIDVSPKTISKWETARGLPDISLLEPLADALAVSVPELLSGNTVKNKNISADMLRSKLYVCPVCGNIIHSAGESMISCCGINLLPSEAEDADDAHRIIVEKTEDEFFVSVSHEMSKKHYISFIAYVTSDRFELVKLYPEGNAECRFNIRGAGCLYFYCNHHGLMKQDIKKL